MALHLLLLRRASPRDQLHRNAAAGGFAFIEHRFHQRPAADPAAPLPHHEKRDIILLKRADIDQMIAFCGVKRRHIGIGKVDEAQNRVLTGCLKLDFDGQCDACLLSKKCVFRRNVTAIGIDEFLEHNSRQRQHTP